MKRILFIGDVVGKAGCNFVSAKLGMIKQHYGVDITVINGENSAQGNGISRASAQQLIRAGADVITTGNHAFRRKNDLDIFEEDYIIRPANYPEGGCIGRGVCTLDMGAYSIAVVNLMGTVYMDQLDNPFTKIDEILDGIDTPNIFLDFHAEATSEKKAMGHYLTGRVSGVFGTHTHVQTSDCRILPKGTGYITDVGMVGGKDSVLGIKATDAIKKFTTKTPVRYNQDTEKILFQSVFFDTETKEIKTVNIQTGE